MTDKLEGRVHALDKPRKEKSILKIPAPLPPPLQLPRKALGDPEIPRKRSGFGWVLQEVGTPFHCEAIFVLALCVSFLVSPCVSSLVPP